MNKNIYKYNNGEKEVFADPMDIDIRFSKAMEMEDIDTVMGWLFPGYDEETKKWKGDDKLFLDAVNRVCPAIAVAFKVKPFDENTGEGFLKGSLINMYSQYLNWMANLKKNTEEL